MTEGNTELNCRGAFVIPNGFIAGEAAGGGDCFFDSVAQGMNELCIAGGPFNVKLLRQACFIYAEGNQGCIYDSQSHKTWRQAIEEDAVAGKYATNSSPEQVYFYIYMANIGLTAAGISSAIWGRPEIEGRMLCQIYGLKLHIIENFHLSGEEVIGHQLVDSSGSRSLDEHSSLYNDPQIIHILNDGLCHFVPILRKTSVPNRPIEKEAYLSPSEGVQSQNNRTDGLTLHPVRSGAVSQQQDSLLVAQPEHLEQGPEKTESVSVVNTHQAVDSRYVKECSITDNSTWSAVAAKKEDADFKILRITNSPTVSAALDFMQQAEFYETFNQASHWFFIVIEVADFTEFPSKAVECLAEILDEQKPVIIQWDLMSSAEYLVFFKQTGQSAFTPIHMNSASLFSTEDELLLELSKQGSFQLPLLLKALQLGIGGQFNGGALDLLNVSFDVKQEIDTWRLIDYATRDDDSLSLRFLLLVDWDLASKNEEGRRTLEIAAEFCGPQSLSALLNLPITSSAEEHFLPSKEKGLLTLRNDLGDNPFLIAAEKGRPETLQFLICCGADILCHRRGNEKVTAIKLAWAEKRYENVRVLLEADSLFPDDFHLGDIEESGSTAALLKLVEDRRSFHQAIKYVSQSVVKTFIKLNPRLKQAYDPSNHSALMTALKAGQCEVYALLQSEGLCPGKNEEPSGLIKELTSEQKYRLKQAKLKYFGTEDESHIIYLLSKSRLGIGQEKKNFAIIWELYKELDTIPEISTILKVLELSAVTEIIFDFDNDSIVDLDPTKSSETKGSCNYREGRIYVGAKEHSKILGTLAHELTHLAMQVCYDNGCNPYEALDKQKKCAFGKIVAECRDTTGIDDIIKRVFTTYKEESDWPKELIVRVPHVLAHYKEEKGKQLLTQQVQELLRFYEQHTQEDLKRFIENPTRIKARHQIQCLNTLLGKMDVIVKSKIWLNDECLLNDDVINCQTIHILTTPLPLLTNLNLYQVLKGRKRLTLSDINSDYIFVSAEQFKNQKKAKAIYEAFQSVTHPTLIIDCSYKYDKSETDLWSTLNCFSEKRRIIFIAVTEVAQSLQDKLKEYKAQIKHDRDYTWNDLTTDSQNELLKIEVCFQGSRVSLNELISAESQVTQFLPLADLLENKTLAIGRPLLKSTNDDCIESYYIPRTFSHQVAIKKDIFEQKFSDDLMTETEQEFTKYCQNNPEKNVHLLLKDKSGRFIWQHSRGSLRTLHKYIDTQNPLHYLPENLDQFLQQAHRQKLMLIADTAGMGKTTVLTHLSKQIKQKFQTYWVVKIDLSDHTDVLEAQMKQKIGTTEFLSEKVLKLRYPFEKELFKQCCQGHKEATKVVLMFDGFDEISPKYKETVLDLLQDLNPLKEPSIEQLWVTTRPHLREDLEDSLHKLCYTLEPFTEDNQVEFLRKFWQQHSKVQEGSRQKLETYARALVEKLTQSISDKEKEFTGIPLQTRMLAESFDEEVKMFCLQHTSEPELFEELRLVDLYRKFIEKRWKIFNSRGELANEQVSKIIMSEISIPKTHQILALEILLPEMKDTDLKLEEFEMLAPEEISRIGIVQYVDKKPHFIHRTFAEYYVAEFLVTRLNRETTFLLEVLNILFKILLGADFMVIRFFLNGLLVNHDKSKVIEQYGKHIYEIWKVEQTYISFEINKRMMTREDLQEVLRQAAYEGSAHIIDFFFSSLKDTGNSETINKLLLYKERSGDKLVAKSRHIKGESRWAWGSRVQEHHKAYLCPDAGFYGRTLWDISAFFAKKEVLDTLWGWGREVQVNLKDDLLLAKVQGSLPAFIYAARYGNKEILETLWGWGREVQVNLKDDLLLAKGKDRLNAFQYAAMNGKKEILDTLWGWGREVQVNLKDDLLLAKGVYGRTAWDYAARNGHKEFLETVWGWGREVQVNLKGDLLLAKDENGRTAWEHAAKNGHKEILETLWGWGREVQVNLKGDLLLAKGEDGRTAWEHAAKNGHKEILETLWGWGREVQVNLKDDLLLAKGKDRVTAFHYAAMKGKKEILDTLWGWGREVQVNLKDDLLLAKGVYGRTAWDHAARNGHKEFLETLWGWGREVQVNLKDDLLLAKGKDRLTAFHYAAMKGKKEILDTLWGWGREVQVNLKGDLLLAKGEYGRTAFHNAAENGHKEILETLWGWGREVQVNLKGDLLLAKGEYGRTAFHNAAENGHKEILETLWGWGREVQVNLKGDLLLAKGEDGRTAWEHAAKNGHKEILETLWGWGREVQVNLKGDLLLAKGEDGRTAWKHAAKNGHKEILETLWVWGREVQVNLKDDLLVAKGKDGLTAWDHAAYNENKEILETLWGWGREVQVNLKDDLLLAKGKDRLTAFHYAAMKGKKEILDTLWGWCREVQVNLKDDLLLAKGVYGRTAWDHAARNGHKEFLETLWGWGREVQVNLKDDLLLAKGEYGRTAWDHAAKNGHKKILETLWGWGREVQVNLKDDLLLAKDEYGRTAWEHAAKNGHKEILETLWGWGREVQVNLKGDLLLAKGEYGRTAFHNAAENGHKEILETLWGWGREVQVKLKDDLLLAKCNKGRTAFNYAEMYDKKEILETLWGWGREVQVNLKDDLLLAKDEDGLTAWTVQGIDFVALCELKML